LWTFKENSLEVIELFWMQNQFRSDRVILDAKPLLTLLNMLLSDNDEIFVDANETSVSPMQESTHASVSKPDAEMLNEDSSSTTADPIFHAYTTQQSQGDEIGAAGVDNSENQATSSDVSLLECNELEWDTCVVDDDAPLIVNEGTLIRNGIWGGGGGGGGGGAG
jgi:hypothetical protein